MRSVGPKAARAGFALGRLLIVPSRAESLPYIVLEAAAAAGIPLIANPAALAHAIGWALIALNPMALHSAALRLRSRVREKFSVAAMTEAVLAAYAETRPVG